ncbi:hypothetical protein M5K25_018538 [Dendrobium thyrsiflorum]|uniref:Uncharacterized protein n=1 Tax=Dendrobium thyrsiflorum TaxID=117978 RepID=A0ABD0UIB5_DENTH
MGDPSSKNLLEDRPAHRSEGSKKTYKKPKTDDAISTITEDSFISFRKKFHFPNDVVMRVPARSDRARFPPPGYVTVYEFSLRAGLRLPPAPELIDIMMICGVSISQFSYRAMSIIMGLIVLFRDRGVVLSSECLSRIGRLLSDVQGRITFRSKWLDIRTRDPSKDALQYEVRYLSRFIDEEYLFKVGLSTQAERSYAQMLKKSVKVPEAVLQKNHSKRPGSKEEEEDVLKHQCIGRRRAEELLDQHIDFRLEMTKTLNDWNTEFMKVKYLQGEYKKKYDAKVKEMKAMEEQLAGCRTELANMITSTSLHNQQMDRLHIDLVDAQTTINQQMKDQQVLEDENKRLQSMLSEKEAQQLPSTVIEDFKKSFAFKIIIEDHVQEARNHIYDVEVKALEAEFMEEGFIKGFMKGVRAVHRKTGANIQGLSPSQASGDPPSDSGGEEVESELQKIFALEEDEDDLEIL